MWCNSKVWTNHYCHYTRESKSIHQILLLCCHKGQTSLYTPYLVLYRIDQTHTPLHTSLLNCLHFQTHTGSWPRHSHDQSRCKPLVLYVRDESHTSCNWAVSLDTLLEILQSITSQRTTLGSSRVTTSVSPEMSGMSAILLKYYRDTCLCLNAVAVTAKWPKCS